MLRGESVGGETTWCGVESESNHGERCEKIHRKLKRVVKALKRHEVAAAVEQARTHVGTTELSLEQWIKVALRYCPKPTS